MVEETSMTDSSVMAKGEAGAVAGSEGVHTFHTRQYPSWPAAITCQNWTAFPSPKQKWRLREDTQFLKPYLLEDANIPTVSWETKERDELSRESS